MRKKYRKDFDAGGPLLSSYFESSDLIVTDEIIDRISGEYAQKIAQSPVVDKAHREFLGELVGTTFGMTGAECSR